MDFPIPGGFGNSRDDAIQIHKRDPKTSGNLTGARSFLLPPRWSIGEKGRIAGRTAPRCCGAKRRLGCIGKAGSLRHAAQPRNTAYSKGCSPTRRPSRRAAINWQRWSKTGCSFACRGTWICRSLTAPRSAFGRSPDAAIRPRFPASLDRQSAAPRLRGSFIRRSAPIHGPRRHHRIHTKPSRWRHRQGPPHTTAQAGRDFSIGMGGPLGLG